MSLDLISQDLKQDIARLLKKDVKQIEENDLLQIKRICLNSESIYGKKTDHTIKDLEKLKNLEHCNILLFNITKQENDILKSIANIKSIQFSHCNFKINELDFNENLEEIFINNCKHMNCVNFLNSSLRKIKIVGNLEEMQDLDLTKWKNLNCLETLEIHYYRIYGIQKILEIAPNLKYLNIDGSKIGEEQDLTELKNKIKISQEERYFMN